MYPPPQFLRPLFWILLATCSLTFSCKPDPPDPDPAADRVDITIDAGGCALSQQYTEVYVTISYFNSQTQQVETWEDSQGKKTQFFDDGDFLGSGIKVPVEVPKDGDYGFTIQVVTTQCLSCCQSHGCSPTGQPKFSSSNNYPVPRGPYTHKLTILQCNCC